jgi:putative ABC transport system permease protein
VESQINTLLKSYPQFRLVSGKDYIDQSMQLFNKAFAAIFALGIFLAVPSLIAMVNTLAIGVIERTREIGMLRAVGATRKQVRTIIIAGAIILSAIGTGFGILAGLYLGYMGVEAIRAAGFPMVFTFPWTGVLVAVSAGLIFGALAAIIPARQAARLEIVQALRYE